MKPFISFTQGYIQLQTHDYLSSSKEINRNKKRVEAVSFVCMLYFYNCVALQLRKIIIYMFTIPQHQTITLPFDQPNDLRTNFVQNSVWILIFFYYCPSLSILHRLIAFPVYLSIYLYSNRKKISIQRQEWVEMNGCAMLLAYMLWYTLHRRRGGNEKI